MGRASGTNENYILILIRKDIIDSKNRMLYLMQHVADTAPYDSVVYDNKSLYGKLRNAQPASTVAGIRCNVKVLDVS